MQCHSCQFENMPGQTHCGRCHSMLSHEGVAVDVIPPRASRNRMVFRNWFSWLKWPHGFFDKIQFDLRGMFRADYATNDKVTEFGLICRMIIPGWVQIYCGQKSVGRIILACYLFCLLMGLYLIASTFTGVFVGLAIALHALSISQVLMGRDDSYWQRIFTSCCCILLIGMLIYYPIGILFNRYANPIVIQQYSPPFLPGDVLLSSRFNSTSQTLSQNLIVLFTPNSYDIRETNAGGGAQIYRIGRRRIDRILGVAGDHVVWNNGTLTVNGKISETLNPNLIIPDFNVQIRPGYVFVIPSSEARISRLDAGQIIQIAEIPVSSVQSLIFFQIAPLSHLGSLD